MAYSIAERIRESVAALQMETPKGSFSVTLSIGVAELWREPADGSIEQVVQRADTALYAAKQSGRNRTVIFAVE
jgi:diguanylate cyclase (GGDEF)-like protein